jgi:hypothetical protein
MIRWETPTLLGPLERFNHNQCTFIWECKQNQFPKPWVLLCYLEYRTMDKVQKSSSPKQYMQFNKRWHRHVIYFAIQCLLIARTTLPWTWNFKKLACNYSFWNYGLQYELADKCGIAIFTRPFWQWSQDGLHGLCCFNPTNCKGISLPHDVCLSKEKVSASQRSIKMNPAHLWRLHNI